MSSVEWIGSPLDCRMFSPWGEYHSEVNFISLTSANTEAETTLVWLVDGKEADKREAEICYCNLPEGWARQTSYRKNRMDTLGGTR